MARACDERLEAGEVVALDGTRIDSSSKNITPTGSGKKKAGTDGPQINWQMLINIKTGAPVCYRTYAGDVNETSTLEDLRRLWTDAGIDKKGPVILMDQCDPSPTGSLLSTAATFDSSSESAHPCAW